MQSEAQILSNIKISQAEDMKLILDLEKLPKDNETLNHQRKILENMYNNAQQRIQYFQQLEQMESLLSEVNQNQQLQIADQKQHLQLVENNIKQMQDKILKNREINAANLRSSEINTLNVG